MIVTWAFGPSTGVDTDNVDVTVEELIGLLNLIGPIGGGRGKSRSAHPHSIARDE